MLVESESMSNLPMKLLESCSTILVANLNSTLTVYLVVDNGSKIGNKNFASVHVCACKADKIGMKGGKTSTHFLCTLKETYIIPGIVPTGFRRLCVSTGILFRINKLFISFMDAFSFAGNEIQEIVMFYSHFLKFALIN